MLNSLKQTSQTIGREISRAWETLSEGWRELLSRSGNALTHFKRGKDAQLPALDKPDLRALTQAMQGHVLAYAELVGQYQSHS